MIMDEIKERFEGKSERWRKRYLLLMTKLYKDVDNDDAHRGSGSGKIVYVDDQTGNKTFRHS